jgi:hypothetical protein
MIQITQAKRRTPAERRALLALDQREWDALPRTIGPWLEFDPGTVAPVDADQLVALLGRISDILDDRLRADIGWEAGEWDRFLRVGTWLFAWSHRCRTVNGRDLMCSGTDQRLAWALRPYLRHLRTHYETRSQRLVYYHWANSLRNRYMALLDVEPRAAMEALRRARFTPRMRSDWPEVQIESLGRVERAETGEPAVDVLERLEDEARRLQNTVCGLEAEGGQQWGE